MVLNFHVPLITNLNLYTWKENPEECNSISQVLNLFFRGYQFKFHIPQSYWTLTWLLTSGLVKLVELHINWPEHPH